VAVPVRPQHADEASESQTQPKLDGRRAVGCCVEYNHSRSRSPAAASDGGGSCSRPSTARRKRYEWMDSGDEASSDEEERRQRSSRPASNGTAAGGGEPSEDRGEDQRRLSVRIADVRAFSDMLRLAPELQIRAPRMAPRELVAAVAAAARVRFYDAEVFQRGLLPAARRQLQSNRCSSLHADQAVDLICGLAELNVYDEAIFSRVVEVFAERKQDLEDPTRQGRLLAAFKKMGHQGDKDFLDYLAQRVKAGRYEQHLREIAQQSGPQIYYGGLRK